MDGWIKIHRKILDWEHRDNPNMFSVFINLIIMANSVSTGIIKRGQVVISSRAFSKSLGLSRQQLRTCLRKLQSCGAIKIEAATQEATQEATQCLTQSQTLVTICNFDSYQGKVKSSNPKSNPVSNPVSNPPNIQEDLKKNKEYNSSSKDSELHEKGEVTVETIPPHPYPDMPEELDTSAETRFRAFYDSLIRYVPKYGRELIREFFIYWSEPLVSDRTKMRFEDEKKWALSNRMARFAINDYNGTYAKYRQSLGESPADTPRAKREQSTDAQIARILGERFNAEQ